MDFNQLTKFLGRYWGSRGTTPPMPPSLGSGQVSPTIGLLLIVVVDVVVVVVVAALPAHLQWPQLPLVCLDMSQSSHLSLKAPWILIIFLRLLYSHASAVSLGGAPRNPIRVPHSCARVVSHFAQDEREDARLPRSTPFAPVNL